jgi:uncharacterized iron-regulated membrane protein
VFVIAITGCLYAFQEEIQNLTQSYRHVVPINKAYLLPSKLQTIAQEELPGKLLHSIKYNEKDKAAEAIFYHYEPTYYYSVYINPYSGEVLKVKDNLKGFFRFILNGHFYLWLPPAIGQPVIAYSTLVFVILLITGIIMWFPRNMYALKQILWFRWKSTTRWKKKNLDLHNILGFYASFIALIIALTGLVWGFQWFANGIYKSTGGKKSLTYYTPSSKKEITVANEIPVSPMDTVWKIMQTEYLQATSIEIHPPENDSSAIAANANLSSGTYWKTDYRYFNQYTMQEMPVNHIYGKIKEARFADKLMRMNYDIHVGAIGGLPGKMLVFIIGLITASLPVTGFIIWQVKRAGRKKSD